MKKNIDELNTLIVNHADYEEISIYSSGVILDQLDNKGRSPLMAASYIGDLQLTSLLIKKGASPNFSGIRGLLPLHEASSNGFLEVVEYLIDAGSKVNALSNDGVTPLMCAAAWGHTEVVKYLLANGADRSIKDNIGATAEDIAREKGEDSIAYIIKNFRLLIVDGKSDDQIIERRIPRDR